MIILKKVFLFLILSITLILSSCSLFDVEGILAEAKENLIIDQEIVAYDFSLPKSAKSGSYSLQVEWESSSELIEIVKSKLGTITAKVDFVSNKEKDTDVILTATISLFNSSTTKEFIVTVPKYDLGAINAKEVTFDNRLDIDGPLTEGCLPSIGNPKMLVIPVNLDKYNKKDSLLNEIEIAFNGTSEQTGYESVKSYYQKSSYGKLNLDINVLDEWFTPERSKSFYENYYNDRTGDDGSVLLLQEALAYYDSKIDYSDYDYNNDGFIDGIWLVYNCDVDFLDSSSIYWAFVYWNYDETEYDGKQAYYYAFGGTDFMHQTKEQAGTYDPTGIKVDAHTFIHETGHLMGLDDYYDYEERKGAKGGVYGADMMDYNIGDHSAASKLLLGWITPTVVSGTGTITLDVESFADTGKCLIVTDRKLLSIYDSYYIIEFYTNTGLNELVKPINGYGIKITKVNAQKNYVNGVVELNTGTYQCGFKYDNSDEEELFIDLICNKNDVKYNGYSLSGNVLFTEKEALKDDNVFFGLVVNTCTELGANITITIE